MNIKKLIKRIKKILLAYRPPRVYRSPPLFRDTKACNIILAENELLVNENLYLTWKVKRSGNDVSKLTEALNDCYSTIAALEKGNDELKFHIADLTKKITIEIDEKIEKVNHIKVKEHGKWITFVRQDEKGREFIGLTDRDGTEIYAGCKLKCKVDCCPGSDELTGIIKWGKFKAGYTLRDLNTNNTIAAFRSPAGFGVMEIKEMPDGRIDGVVIEE